MIQSKFQCTNESQDVWETCIINALKVKANKANEANVNNDDIDSVYSNIKYVNYVPTQSLSTLQKGFSIASLNVRSMLKNGMKVQEFLAQTEIDVLAVQETWSSEATFPHHEFIQLNRPSKRGGGVGFLINKFNLNS